MDRGGGGGGGGGGGWNGDKGAEAGIEWAGNGG